MAVMPFTLHGDIIFLHTTPHLLAHGEWNVYELGVADLGQEGYYPPLTMLLFGFFQYIFGTLFSGYEAFTHALLKIGEANILTSPHLYSSLFLMKVPYLVVDCILIFVCQKILSDESQKKVFVVLWGLNPLVIYVTYMMGQYDLFPAFCVVLACHLALKPGKAHWACLSISAGCLLKIFPIVFLPVVVLACSRNLKDFIRLSLYGILPVIFFYQLFYLLSGDAVIKLFYDMNYNIRLADDWGFLILRFSQAAIYLGVCAHVFFRGRHALTYLLMVQYFLVIFFAVYWGFYLQLTQYYIWFMPVLILNLIMIKKRKWEYYTLIGIIFLEGLGSRTACFGLLAPIHPELFMSLPCLKDVTGFLFDQQLYDRILKTMFLGLTGYRALEILYELYFSKVDSLPGGKIISAGNA